MRNYYDRLSNVFQLYTTGKYLDSAMTKLLLLQGVYLIPVLMGSQKHSLKTQYSTLECITYVKENIIWGCFQL